MNRIEREARIAHLVDSYGAHALAEMLIEAESQPAPVAVPEGWKIDRTHGHPDDCGIMVLMPGGGGVILSDDTESHEHVAHTVLYELAKCLLNAPPAPTVDEHTQSELASQWADEISSTEGLPADDMFRDGVEHAVQRLRNKAVDMRLRAQQQGGRDDG